MFYVYLNKLNKLRVVFWLAMAVVVAVMLGMQVQAKIREAAANVESLTQIEEIRHTVTTIVIEPAVWESWRSYYGQTKAARAQEVTAFVREMIQSVHVQVGDTVMKDQTVVTLLKEDHDVRARASQTSYEEARLNHNRLAELNKQGGVPQSDVDRAYVLMRAAEADAQTYRSTLQRTELKSSIDGVVAARHVAPGEVAEVGRSLVSIVDPSELEAELMVSKRDINHINRDTSVELLIDDVVSQGQVMRISPEAQAGSGLYTVVVGLPADVGARPGTYLEGRFLVNRQESVFVIPSNVVMYRGDRQFVYVVKDDKAGLVEIKTGEGRNGKVVVTSGLSAGDQLIISGNRPLFDGALISKSEGAS